MVSQHREREATLAAAAAASDGRHRERTDMDCQTDCNGFMIIEIVWRDIPLREIREMIT